MLNHVPAFADARQPRHLVKVNDEITAGVESFEVDNNTFYQADTFRVCFAIASLPPDRGPDWWASQSEITIEIFAGFPGDAERFTSAELESLIYGLVDDVTLEPATGKVVVSGRDMTSAFIDAKTTEKWVNQTSSSIATALAFRHGLNPVVTDTTTRTGRYYEIDHARLTEQRTEWDLLTWLAHEEGFSVYVKGRDLHFEPKTSPDADPYLLQWIPPSDDRGHPYFNGKSIEFSRNLTLARGVVVSIRSWNGKSGKAFSVSFPTNKAKGTAPGKASPAAQVFPYTIPGLTPEQALQKAQALHKAITAQEVKLSATLPADNLLEVTKIIKVVGTGTAFDQVYYPESINRSMSIYEGYIMRISAKNHTPESVVPA